MQYLTNFDLPVCRQGLWGILKRWLLSLQALPLWAVFALVAMANVANVRFAVALNEWNGRFFNALQKVDASAIYDALFDFIWLASALILLLVMTQYIKNRLLLSLRRELTFRLIDVWMSPTAAHYQLRESGREPDNPDQRIIEDSRELVGLAVNLSLSFLESVLTIGSFSVILWNLSGSVLVFGIEVPGYMFWVCLAYTVFATVITHWIGHPLKRLNYASQAKEADLRYAFIEKRRHADAIAGAQGEAFEAQHLKERLEALLAVLIAYVKKQRDLDLFTVGLGQVTHLAPIFFLFRHCCRDTFNLEALCKFAGPLPMLHVRFRGLFLPTTTWQASPPLGSVFHISLADWKRLKINVGKTCCARNQNVTKKNALSDMMPL